MTFAPLLMGGSYSSTRYPSPAQENVIWTTWFDFDLTHVDALGIDIYPWSSDNLATLISTECQPVTDAATSVGKHVCIGEFGLRAEYNWTDAQTQQILTDLIAFCDDHASIVDLCLYFESSNPPGTCALLPVTGDTPQNPLAAEVWREACRR